MTNQVIPEAAVEAIHGAICDESLEDHLNPDWPGRCVKAVEAAAPFLMRAAWDEGWEARGDWGGPTPNPYKGKP